MDKIVIYKGEKYLVCVEWRGCHYAANVVLTSPNIPKSSGFKKIPHEAIGDIEKMKSFIVNIIQNIDNHELSVFDKWDGVLDGQEGQSEIPNCGNKVSVFASAESAARALLRKEIENNPNYVLENPRRFKDLCDGYMEGVKFKEAEQQNATDSSMVKMTQKEQDEVCYKLWDELPIEYRDISEYSDFAVGFMTCVKHFKSNGQLMLKKK